MDCPREQAPGAVTGPGEPRRPLVRHHPAIVATDPRLSSPPVTRDVTVDEWTVVYAARYALGRHTGVPAEVAATVRRAWPRLGTDARRVIDRDLADHIRHAGTEPPDITHVWRELRRWTADHQETP